MNNIVLSRTCSTSSSSSSSRSGHAPCSSSSQSSPSSTPRGGRIYQVLVKGGQDARLSRTAQVVEDGLEVHEQSEEGEDGAGEGVVLTFETQNNSVLLKQWTEPTNKEGWGGAVRLVVRGWGRGS